MEPVTPVLSTQINPVNEIKGKKQRSKEYKGTINLSYGPQLT